MAEKARIAVSMMLAQTSNTLSSKSPNLEAQQLQALIAAHQQQQALYSRAAGVPPALWPGLPSPFGLLTSAMNNTSSPNSSSSTSGSSAPVSPAVSAGVATPNGGVVSPRPMLPLGLQRFTPYVLPKASTPPLTSHLNTKASPPMSPAPSAGSPPSVACHAHEDNSDRPNRSPCDTPPSREVSPPSAGAPPSVSPPRH